MWVEESAAICFEGSRIQIHGDPVGFRFGFRVT